MARYFGTMQVVDPGFPSLLTRYATVMPTLVTVCLWKAQMVIETWSFTFCDTWLWYQFDRIVCWRSLLEGFLSMRTVDPPLHCPVTRSGWHRCQVSLLAHQSNRHVALNFVLPWWRESRRSCCGDVTGADAALRREKEPRPAPSGRPVHLNTAVPGVSPALR